MDFAELGRKTRSIRRFGHDRCPSEKEVLSFVDSARLAPCGGNLQLLRFSVITDEDRCRSMFPALKWAGYLHDWNGPEPGERPTAYVVIHAPDAKKGHIPVDAGIAAAYIVLSAGDSGYGSCMIMSFGRESVSKVVNTPESYHPLLVIAIGEPGEEVILENAGGSIEYWRDAGGRHHVPKLSLKEIITF